MRRREFIAGLGGVERFQHRLRDLYEGHAPESCQFRYGLLILDLTTLAFIVATSFALVDPTPQVQDDAEIEIRPDELKIDTYRATGAGGQNVNKTETAIRITHLPSGIVVSCQNERSQLQNRETAMRILKARLLEKRVLEQEAEQARERGEMRSADWGSQIRSYVIRPYTLVKDHRTGVEVGDPTRVLDGDIDVFIEAALSKRKPTGGGTPSAQ